MAPRAPAARFRLARHLLESDRRKDGTMKLTTTEWLVLLGAVVVVAVLVSAIVRARIERRRHAELKSRFGPEYDRAIEQHQSVSRAEQELLAREKRVHQLHLRALPENDRARFGASWEQVQARFVDDPSGAVQAADDLIKAVMAARGYVVEHFEQRIADLS